ncbi:Heme-degrading monooxygenase HmoA [Cohaesibacter sp. ES.047]|uniref:antibiotic biosynthesis monooxygenase family protein n=1 Tax=Cohaesibacter sp. ES.047 TaxID=1798205 RepID=UPI000BB9A522|nr:antibiotic biosynthesis monooxygenase [Cohaesibacter sp. ES.047]SNY91271.1 Heme-degrading monooxygenase HmoA [Cohaesibacter sp. ES.047]
MYVAMNRFLVKKGFEEAFESIWANRESKLTEMDGFLHFDLLKGADTEDGYVLYASHAIWRDEESFIGWTKSQQFRESHASVIPTVEYKGRPNLELFTAVEGLSIRNWDA